MNELREFVKKLEQRFAAKPDQPEPQPLESTLKGLAVELWSDASGRLFLVADQEDAKLLKEPRGTVYTAAEVRRIIAIGDPAVVAEVHTWKKKFHATVSEFCKDAGQAS